MTHKHVVNRPGVVEAADNGWVAEASTLGLPPGYWPDTLVFPGWGEFAKDVEKRRLPHRRWDRHECELLWVGYTATATAGLARVAPKLGDRLVVWND